MVEPTAVLQRLESLAPALVVDRGCLLLPGPPYPEVWFGGERVTLSRLIYFLTHPEGLPPGWTVDHDCHNRDMLCLGGPTCRHRRCIWPDHLLGRPALDNLAAARAVPRWRPRLSLERPARPRRVPPPGDQAWVATVHLAIELGELSPDADAHERHHAAWKLGRRLYDEHGLRATDPRLHADGRGRGFYRADLVAAGVLPR